MSSDLTKPFRLSLDFWVAYVLLGVPVLWFARPWSWELPVISRIAGLVFLPFAASIVCYGPFLFIAAIARGSSAERRVGFSFFAAAISAALFLGIVWLVYDFERVPSPFGFVAVIVANLIFAFLQARKPDLPPKPMPPERHDSS